MPLLSARMPRERPSSARLIGHGGLLTGVALYFGPIDHSPSTGVALAVALPERSRACVLQIRSISVHGT